MKLETPFLLNLLWGLIPLFGIMAYGIMTQKKIVSGFAGPQMIPSIVPGFDPKRRWIKAGLVIVAFGFAIVALCVPQWGYRWEKITQKGVDIMIALDCSKSMLAQDITPNRLERAKREIIDLLRMMKSDRAGLVAFSGNAILQCPLTIDHEAFNIFLKVLEPGFLPLGGTNLDSAIKTCYTGFEKDSDTRKAIIVITDGEATLGDAAETAREMVKQGIQIFCIGVGDLQGAPIPDDQGGFKKDGAGNIILSRVDEKGLERLAAMTKGAYVRSVAGDMDLDLIYTNRIRGTMELKNIESGKKKIWENRYQWFLFPCIVLLMIEWLLPVKKRIKGVRIIMVLMGLGMVAVHTGPVHAKMVASSVKDGIKAFEQQDFEQAKTHFIDAQLKDPQNAALYYNIGAAAYMNKEYDQARHNFIQALKTTDAKLAHDAKYNLANTYYRLGNMDEAIKTYEDILGKFPDDLQAKENLELARQKKEAQQQQGKNSESDNDKENREDKENKDKNPDQNRDQNLDQKHDQEKGQDKDQDKSGQGNDSGQDKNQVEEQHPPEDGQGDENKPAGQSETDQDQARADETASLADKQSQQAGQVLENMLNRLEDKPGRAMMPATQEQHVEKDW